MQPTTDNLKAVGNLLFGTQWQTDMAELMGVDSRTVRRWASGANIPGGVWAELLNHLRFRRSSIDRALLEMNNTHISRMTLSLDQADVFKRALSNGIALVKSSVDIKTTNQMPPTDDPGEPGAVTSFADRARQAPLVDTLNRLAIITQDIDHCRGEKPSRGPVIMTLIPDDDDEDNDKIIIEFDATATGPSMLVTLCMDASYAAGDREAARLMCKLLEQ